VHVPQPAIWVGVVSMPDYVITISSLVANPVTVEINSSSPVKVYPRSYRLVIIIFMQPDVLDTTLYRMFSSQT